MALKLVVKLGRQRADSWRGSRNAAASALGLAFAGRPCCSIWADQAGTYLRLGHRARRGADDLGFKVKPPAAAGSAASIFRRGDPHTRGAGVGGEQRRRPMARFIDGIDDPRADANGPWPKCCAPILNRGLQGASRALERSRQGPGGKFVGGRGNGNRPPPPLRPMFQTGPSFFDATIAGAQSSLDLTRPAGGGGRSQSKPRPCPGAARAPARRPSAEEKPRPRERRGRIYQQSNQREPKQINRGARRPTRRRAEAGICC